MNNNRDNFTAKTIEILAQRVNYHCSNPDCRKGTSGPRSDGKALRTGVASHICAAAPGGPRYDSNMTSDERKSPENGIWLCQTCSKLIDSDINIYTVEILKKWKKDTENWASKSLITSPFESTNLSNDIYTSIDKTNIDLNQIVDSVNHDNNKIFYGVPKEYLNLFVPLNDYIFCNYYSNSFASFFNKKFEFDDESLTFLKDLIDWIMGKKKFPLTKLKKFYKNVKVDLLSCKPEILEKRWQALYYFFAGNLEKAKEIYLSIKENKEFNTVEQWIKDDILIDGRNILIRIENNSQGYLKNVFQQEIEKNKYNITNPNVDRLKCNLYETIIKNIFNYQNKSKYTEIYGIGLEYIFNVIQNLIYITVSYGSITHLLLVRKVIAEIISTYANCYGDEIFYRIALKEKILNDDFKDFKKMYENIKLKYRFVESKNFIDEILKLENSILQYNLEEYYVFIFDTYGRHLDDEIFNKYETIITDIVINKSNSMTTLNALKSITNNIDRFCNKSNLFDLLLEFVKKGEKRYFNEIEILISNIKPIELTKKEKGKFTKLVIECYSTNEISVIEAAIRLKKVDNIKIFDNLLLKKGTEENCLYCLAENNNIDSLTYIVNELIKRANERESNPSTHYGYSTNYSIGINFFESHNKQIIKIIDEKILPLSHMILNSKNQYAIEKIKMLKTLSYIFLKEENYRKAISEIINDINYECPETDFVIFKSGFSIRIYHLLFDYLYKKISLLDLLYNYLNFALENNNLIEEICESIIIVNKYKRITSVNFINLIYSIFKLGISSNDYEIRKSVIKISYIFIRSKHFETILNNLLELVSSSDFSESIAIANMLYTLPKSKQTPFKMVIDKMKSNNNYNIRYIANKYFKNI